jgi:hypothetical protein
MKRGLSTKRRRSRRERVYASYARAAADREYMAEMVETDRAFDSAVADGLAGGELPAGRAG